MDLTQGMAIADSPVRHTRTHNTTTTITFHELLDIFNFAIALLSASPALRVSQHQKAPRTRSHPQRAPKCRRRRKSSTSQAYFELLQLPSMSPYLSIIPYLHLTSLSIPRFYGPGDLASVLSAAENTHKVHRGQPIPAPAQAMPAPTIIFAPILLPCPIYLALQHGEYESGHVFSCLSYYSYSIKDTLEIEPGDPGAPKYAHATSFVAIGASISRLDSGPARSIKPTS
jgi:hypothetical protein